MVVFVWCTKFIFCPQKFHSSSVNDLSRVRAFFLLLHKSDRWYARAWLIACPSVYNYDDQSMQLFVVMRDFFFHYLYLLLAEKNTPKVLSLSADAMRNEEYKRSAFLSFLCVRGKARLLVGAGWAVEALQGDQCTLASTSSTLASTSSTSLSSVNMKLHERLSASVLIPGWAVGDKNPTPLIKQNESETTTIFHFYIDKFSLTAYTPSARINLQRTNVPLSIFHIISMICKCVKFIFKFKLR